MKYYGDIDLNQNRLLQAVIDQGDTFPSTPMTGQLFYLWPTNNYNIDDGLYVYEGPSSGVGNQSQRPRDYDDYHSGNYDGAPYERGYQGWVKAGALTAEEIEELKGVTLDGAYDAETGNRIIYMDNGSIDWQLLGNYQFGISDGTNGLVVIQRSGSNRFLAIDMTSIDVTISDTAGDSIDINTSGGIDIDIGINPIQIDGNNLQVGGTDIILYDDGGTYDGWVEAKGFKGTDASATSTLAGNLIISGNLIVSGTTTTLETQKLTVEDNIIVINNGELGAGVTAGTSGIQVDRGTEDDEWLIFNETDDRWHVGFDAESGAPDAPAVMAVRVQKDFLAGDWTLLSGNIYYIDFVYEDEGQSSSSGNTSDMLHTLNVQVQLWEKNGTNDYEEVGFERWRVFYDAGNSNKATARVTARQVGGTMFDGKIVVVG